MSNTEGLPNYMTKFSGLTREQLDQSVRNDLDAIRENLKRLGIPLTPPRDAECVQKA